MTIGVLADHRRRAQSRAGECAAELTEEAFLFSRSPVGDRPWVPNDVTKAYSTVRKTEGLECVRLHDFRHFVATRMLAAGVPVRTVSGRRGYSNAATTLGVYGHFVEGRGTERTSRSRAP